MSLKRWFPFLLVLIIDWRGIALAATYEQEVEQWRVEQEKNLRKEDGWLTVVGLWWLQAGDNSIGSGDKKDVVLPAGTPDVLGNLSLKDGQVSLKLSNIENIWVDGKPAIKEKTYALLSDESPNKTVIDIAHRVTFFVIKRQNGVGIRVKDKDSETRKKFKGRTWFPIYKDLVLNAKWVALKNPKEIIVPDVLGNKSTEKVSGYVEFILAGKTIQLYPNSMDEGLFFVFRDGTSGRTTYGAGRFLSAALPQDGKVRIDFNKAVNPPCAFTHYATCPLPPKENIVSVAIEAGELKTH